MHCVGSVSRQQEAMKSTHTATENVLDAIHEQVVKSKGYRATATSSAIAVRLNQLVASQVRDGNLGRICRAG